MLLHELAHLVAAIYIGLVPSHIIIEPFGVNLRLKNQVVYSLSDEIILYLAGPLVNLLFSLGGMILNAKLASPWLSDFIIKNIALFTINILPILPLDGGVILKKILSHLFGHKNAFVIMRTVTGAMTLTLATIGIILTVKSQFNFSVIFLCVFLIMNIFMQKEKYNVDFVRELMFYRKKGSDLKSKKIRLLAANKGDSARSVAEKFTKNSFSITFVLDDNYRIENIVTESELMDRIIENGANSTLCN